VGEYHGMVGHAHVVVVSETACSIPVVLVLSWTVMALMTEWVPIERSHRWFGPYVVLACTRTQPEGDNGRVRIV
jgi:hypothetical protein